MRRGPDAQNHMQHMMLASFRSPDLPRGQSPRPHLQAATRLRTRVPAATAAQHRVAHGLPHERHRILCVRRGHHLQCSAKRPFPPALDRLPGQISHDWLIGSPFICTDCLIGCPVRWRRAAHQAEVHPRARLRQPHQALQLPRLPRVPRGSRDFVSPKPQWGLTCKNSPKTFPCLPTAFRHPLWP